MTTTGVRKSAQSSSKFLAVRRRAHPHRARPGSKWSGKYFRIEVRPRTDYTTFRYHDVGRPGHALRLAGLKPSGVWADAAWLISKRDAHVRDGVLVADEPKAREILKAIGPARQVEADIFRGHPRRRSAARTKSKA